MEMLRYSVWQSPIGPLTLVASERGLLRLEFGERLLATNAKAEFVQDEECFEQHRRQLHEYFAGERREFDLLLDLRGTDFQLRCWRALLAIPYGETRSYAEQARVVGQPQAFRAVGMANGDNPIAIVVPCHRVINTGGKLGGYGGGLDLKRRLLDLESGQAVLLQRCAKSA